MKTAKDALKASVNGILSSFDLEIRRKTNIYHCSYRWTEDARKAGMEINDFVEKDHLKPALEELERVVFPYISARSAVCELGPGTGCYSRRIAEKLSDGELHLVDWDEGTIEFLKQYLKSGGSIHAYVNNGYQLPFEKSAWLDLVFCASTFTGISLSYFCAYIREFARVLKPGAYAVFDYFDVAVEAGWNNLMHNMARPIPIFNYNYHTTETIDKLVALAGFEITGRQDTIRGSTFVVARKAAQ